MPSGRNKSNKSLKAYERALRVLARMRRTEQTLTTASRDEQIDPRTVRKYVRADLRDLKKERQTVATKSDRRHRRMLIPTRAGTANAVVRGSREASQLGRYMSAVGAYLRTGEAAGLMKFEGQSIAGHPLITDPDQLTYLAEAGSLQLESIYALPESSS